MKNYPVGKELRKGREGSLTGKSLIGGTVLCPSERHQGFRKACVPLNYANIWQDTYLLKF